MWEAIDTRTSHRSTTSIGANGEEDRRPSLPVACHESPEKSVFLVLVLKKAITDGGKQKKRLKKAFLHGEEEDEAQEWSCANLLRLGTMSEGAFN